ncbi:hypothetical protein ACE418_13110 [Megasphaera sp. WILCCON 0056]|uniref:hypothetical protein n=1 Tax=Megasphaera sp. WILCCON 0056 TaxID=3345340 RepID=UPI003A7FB254
MKRWKKVILTCMLGMGISFGIGGIAPQNMLFISPAYAAEAIPMEDTWLLSYGDNQYYLKGGTLQFRQPTREVRASGAYSFQAKIICVYPDGSYETHQYRMASKGALGVSIDGGPTTVVDSDSLYAQLYNAIGNKYVW